MNLNTKLGRSFLNWVCILLDNEAVEYNRKGYFLDRDMFRNVRDVIREKYLGIK